jgi:hypothetical protein
MDEGDMAARLNSKYPYEYGCPFDEPIYVEPQPIRVFNPITRKMEPSPEPVESSETTEIERLKTAIRDIVFLAGHNQNPQTACWKIYAIGREALGKGE